MFAGSLMITVSWGLIHVLSLFYKHHLKPLPARNLCPIISDTIIIKDNTSTYELVRLASTSCMLLSAVGWGIFMGGLMSTNVILILYYLPGGWGALIIVPFVHVSCISTPCWLYRESQHCDGNLCFHTQHLLNCWYGVLSHCYS